MFWLAAAAGVIGSPGTSAGQPIHRLSSKTGKHQPAFPFKKKRTAADDDLPITLPGSKRGTDPVTFDGRTMQLWAPTHTGHHPHPTHTRKVFLLKAGRSCRREVPPRNVLPPLQNRQGAHTTAPTWVGGRPVSGAGRCQSSAAAWGQRGWCGRPWGRDASAGRWLPAPGDTTPPAPAPLLPDPPDLQGVWAKEGVGDGEGGRKSFNLRSLGDHLYDYQLLTLFIQYLQLQITRNNKLQTLLFQPQPKIPPPHLPHPTSKCKSWLSIKVNDHAFVTVHTKYMNLFERPAQGFCSFFLFSPLQFLKLGTPLAWANSLCNWQVYHTFFPKPFLLYFHTLQDVKKMTNNVIIIYVYRFI